MHIIVTLPAYVKWEDYQRELEAVADGEGFLNFRVPTLPKVNEGERCYLLWRGAVRGWQRIMRATYWLQGFRCLSTGKWWDPGCYVLRTGLFHYQDPPVPMKGFRGYRYLRDPFIGMLHGVEVAWTDVAGQLVPLETAIHCSMRWDALEKVLASPRLRRPDETVTITWTATRQVEQGDDPR